MKTTLIDLLNVSKSIPNTGWTVQDAVSKLFEEGGELSEAAMIKSGRLPHKTLVEDGDFEETADVLICALDVLAKLNLNMTSDEISDKLNEILIKKIKKWEKVQGRFL